jgi:hypothetical protein
VTAVGRPRSLLVTAARRLVVTVAVDHFVDYPVEKRA